MVSCSSRQHETLSSVYWGPHPQIHEIWVEDVSYPISTQMLPLMAGILCIRWSRVGAANSFKVKLFTAIGMGGLGGLGGLGRGWYCIMLGCIGAV